ncbi:16608_t:CDS:2 [Entrophospora sp. SA101]|nr:16608_t:CDS:2 [Entrophospora sp. SA101]
MAEYLASIYGTEKDKVNCSFYFKIGACRHGQMAIHHIWHRVCGDDGVY